MAAFNFKICVPDDDYEEVLEAFVKVNGWTETVLGEEGPVPNPESKLDAASRIVLSFIRNSYTRYIPEIDATAAKESSLQRVLAVQFTAEEP